MWAEPALDLTTVRQVRELGTDVSWYKRNLMTAGDNPHVGVLRCTCRNHTLLEYALADLPNQIFVSKCQLELPSKEQLQPFMDAQIGEATRDG